MVYLFFTELKCGSERLSEFSRPNPSENAIEKMAGKQLLRIALQKLNLPNDLIIEKNAYGKPYFINSPIHFNISHSKGIVVCCISACPIGVDIQKYCYIHKKSVDFFWNYNDFINYSATITCNIIDVWSQKEAVSKFLGLGMSYPFRNIFIEKSNDQSLTATVDSCKYFLERVQIHEKYSSWIATNSKVKSIIQKKIIL